MIVVDTNIIVYLFLPSEYSVLAEKVVTKDPNWAAPFLWRSEFCNVLLYFIRKKGLPLAKAVQIMEQAQKHMDGNEYETIPLRVLQFAAESSCSAYDCEFVALAYDLGVPLVTVDKQILAQFPQIAISLEKYVFYENS